MYKSLNCDTRSDIGDNHWLLLNLSFSHTVGNYHGSYRFLSKRLKSLTFIDCVTISKLNSNIREFIEHNKITITRPNDQ